MLDLGKSFPEAELFTQLIFSDIEGIKHLLLQQSIPELYEPFINKLQEICQQGITLYHTLESRDVDTFEKNADQVLNRIIRCVLLLICIKEKPERLAAIFTFLLNHSAALDLLLQQIKEIMPELPDFVVITHHFNLNRKKIILDKLAHFDALAEFVCMLAAYVELTPNYSTYDNAGPNVQQFLNYRPGKIFPSVYENFRKSVAERTNIRDLFWDFSNTTDEDSSDAFEEEFELSDEDKQLLEGKAQQAVDIQKKLNHYVIKKNSGVNIAHYNDKYAKKSQLVSFLLFRGEHFRPTDFSTKKVRDHYHSPNKNQPTVHDMLLSDIELQRPLEYSAEELKKIEASYRKISRNYHEEYAEDAEAENKRIEYHVSKKSDGKDDSPYISYSISIKKSLQYAVNYKRGLGSKRQAHYRKSTKRPKHPNCGDLNIYLISAPLYNNQFVSISDRLWHQNTITVTRNRRYELEVVQMLYLPQQYHLRRITVSYPDLNSATFTGKQFRSNYLKKLWKKDTNAVNEALDEILRKSIENLYQTLENNMRVYAYKQRLEANQVILYPHSGGTVQNTIPKFKFRVEECGKTTHPMNKKYTDPFKHVTQGSTSQDNLPLDITLAKDLFRTIFTDGLYQPLFVLHNGLHHARTAILAKILYFVFSSKDLIEKCYENKEGFLSNNNLLTLEAVAMLHDVGRKKDSGPDKDEKKSQEICKTYLQTYLSLETAKAHFFSTAILLKHKQQPNRNLFFDLLHDADMLEAIRDCHNGIFYYQKLFLYKHCQNLGIEDNFIIELIKAVTTFIDSQGDIHQTRKSDNTIVVKEGHERGQSQNIRATIAITHINNPVLRATYNDVACYEKLLSELQNNLLLWNYFFYKTKAHSLDSDSTSDPSPKKQKTSFFATRPTNINNATEGKVTTALSPKSPQ